MFTVKLIKEKRNLIKLIQADVVQLHTENGATSLVTFKGDVMDEHHIGHGEASTDPMVTRARWDVAYIENDKGSTTQVVWPPK